MFCRSESGKYCQTFVLEEGILYYDTCQKKLSPVMCKKVCNAQKEDKHLKVWTGYTAN